MSDEVETYQELQDRLKAEGQTKEDILSRYEDAIDLDNLPTSTHNWVKRGAKLNCEGAGHPFHEHFLVNK